MIGPLAVEDVAFVVALGAIAAAYRLALRRVDDALQNTQPLSARSAPVKRGRSW